MSALILNGYALPCEPRSNAPDPQDRQEEDLHFGALPTLARLRLARLPAALWARFPDWQSRLLWLLPHVARHYEVDEEALLAAWARHYGPGLAREEA
jgi:hypothetical protein